MKAGFFGDEAIRGRGTGGVGELGCHAAKWRLAMTKIPIAIIKD